MWGSKNSVVCVPGVVELWVDPSKDRKAIPLEPDWSDDSTQVLSRTPVTFDPRSRHAVRRSPDILLVAYSPLGSPKLTPSNKACLEGLGFQLSKEVMSNPMIRAFSVTDKSGSSNEEENLDQRINMDLSSDIQEDSVAQVVGWDPVGTDSTNVPQLNLEERDLQEFLAERQVGEAAASILEFMGVESPADLVFLYFEDLVEFGLTPEDAERTMRGIHPLGTRRPDNPTLCSLTTGEVRLFDRSHRQIPWVFQNRTLDHHSPGPPVQGLGVNVPEGLGHDNVDRRDWLEIEEARHQAQEEVDTTEIRMPVLSAESSQSQVPAEVASGSTDGIRFHGVEQDQWIQQQVEMTRLQSLWECESENECEGDFQAALMRSLAQEPSHHSSTSQPLDNVSDTAEIPVLSAESSQSQVRNEYTCKAIRSSRWSLGQGTAQIPGQVQDSSKAIRSPLSMQSQHSVDGSSIGVPTWDPVSVLMHPLRPRVISKATNMFVRKVDENMYTKDVERLLGSLTSGLKVVHNVSPSEVRLHLERWKKAAQTEVTALEEMKAIRRLRGVEAKTEMQIPGTQVLPAKTVFTVKPGSGESFYRRKCRVVGCGNFETREPGIDVYAGGIPADVLRACLIESAAQGFSAFITDVRNAFLLAPIPPHEKVRILLRPPRVLQDMGITEEGECWAIDKALYGLRQSPRWWGNYRDKVLKEARRQCGDENMHLRQCEVEPNLWMIESPTGVIAGYVIVYVDDVLILSSRAQASALYTHITKQWECTSLQEATEHEPVTFLGVDIQLARDNKGTVGFELSQCGYIDELLRAYSITPTKKQCPVPKDWVKDLPEQEQYEPDTLRRAQKITGELLWITQRTRVDLAYAVSLI